MVELKKDLPEIFEEFAMKDDSFRIQTGGRKMTPPKNDRFLFAAYRTRQGTWALP